MSPVSLSSSYLTRESFGISITTLSFSTDPQGMSCQRFIPLEAGHGYYPRSAEVTFSNKDIESQASNGIHGDFSFVWDVFSVASPASSAAPGGWVATATFPPAPPSAPRDTSFLFPSGLSLILSPDGAEMSIFQPVSWAASRTFCPPLPIASENWS